MNRCVVCGCAVNPNVAGVYREVNGWEVVRTQGGAHGVSARRETGRVACVSCGDLIRRGWVIDQPSLFAVCDGVEREF